MESLPEDWERATAIVAHPDDLEYGMASAIARFTRQGKHIVYVLATSGEAGIDGVAPQRCRSLREDEERRSAAIVGVDQVEFLGHPDGLVEYGVPLRRDLARAIRKHQPEIVFGMNFDLTWGEGGGVNHSDHRVVGLVLLDACRDGANRWLFPELGEPWSGIKAAFVFGGGGTPSHYVDVTDTIDLGVRSLSEHDAYINGLGTQFDPDQFLRDIAGFGGAAAGCEYAVLLRKFEV